MLELEDQLGEITEEMKKAKITPKFDPMAMKAKLEKQLTRIVKQINQMDRIEKIKEFFTSPSWNKLEKTKEGHDAAYEFVKNTLPYNKVLFYDSGKVTNDSDGLYDKLTQKQKDLIAYVDQKKEENFQVYQLDGLNVFYIGSTAATTHEETSSSKSPWYYNIEKAGW